MGIVGIIWFGAFLQELNRDPNLSDPLNTDTLPSEMAVKADVCHQNGMKAGRVVEFGKLVGIRCYE